MKTNTLKTTTTKEVIVKTIGRDYEKPKLKPPVFEDAVVRKPNVRLPFFFRGM